MMFAVDATEPLVPGRFYQVPCIFYRYCGMTDWWPVLGPRHKDVAFLNFPHLHYHVDGRFLSKRQRRHLAGYAMSLETLAGMVSSRPLNLRNGEPPPPEPTVKRRKCSLARIDYAQHHQPNIQKIATHFAAHKCKRGEQGWICPHQATPLGSIAPVDGVITCPLHGLRIDAATGLVLTTLTKPESAHA